MLEYYHGRRYGEAPGSFPGSNSAKLTHDFCHLESRYCDDEYTNFSFVDIAGHKIWPFYTSENFQEHLWIWVSPRRFAIISGHPTNEKLNHFYSNKMHEHHILANRTISWSVDTVVNDKGKVIERTIAPSEDTRLRSASHETFVTGFEDKYFASPGGRKEDGSYGKRKHSESTGQARAKQFDPTNTYSARDMQAWDRGMKPLQIRHDRRRHQQANLGSRSREHSGRMDKSQRLNLKQKAAIAVQPSWPMHVHYFQ